MNERKATVVGGGIGGLATAVALTSKGWTVEVLERAPELREVGAGLSLWPNALRALAALGVGEQVRAQAMSERSTGIRDDRGRFLSRLDTVEMARRYGTAAMIHRPDLLATLAQALPPGTLRTGVKVTGVLPDGSVAHSDGVSEADLVVGADGIHSAVRRSLWPGAAAPRYSGYSTWRAVTEPIAIEGGGESWGRGLRFGYAGLPDGRVYCFAAMNAEEGAPHQGLAQWRRQFDGWHDPIPALLDATPADAVLRHDVYELPPLPTYVRGRVALVGDAAHAMTPNLGQGACQALEDAVVLADCMERPDGLSAYDAQRRPRSQMIARRARQIGVAAQWSSGTAVMLRNAAMRAMPGSSFLKNLDPVLTWNPPAGNDAAGV
ncbi:FAD-dependent monooxygenase [Streptomyces sp. NPDC007984]|uniref:FAD-dependent monooxygenase n=1 Tax=Streptomyces sp. NPDC007984 TaxID=3364801 RepID=UPI0036F040BF